MALIHYLCTGHFVPEGGFLKIERMRPVCARPLDSGVLSVLFHKFLGDQATPGTVPDAWHMSVYTDHILCDRYGSPADALAFVADYARMTGAQTIDLGTFALVVPEDIMAQ